mmetsp:Transcript_48493/g.138608  ORF Transcript_48493/g.138608 Transcript_48493/m.138608 type:complete len:233 (-) Transcript_48493:573-1271(-)
MRGADDGRVRGEGAHHEGDAHGPVRVAALHEVRGAADCPGGVAAAQGLAQHHDVRVHAVDLLRTAGAHLEGPDLVEDQRDIACGADLADLAEPEPKALDGGGPSIELRGPHLRRAGGGPAEALHGVHQDSSYLAPPEPEQLQRGLRLILQDQTVRIEPLVASALHHPIPPAMVGSPKHRNERASLVESHLLHCAHHRLGATHVKGNLLFPEDLCEHLNVLDDKRVHWSQAWP